MLRRPASLGCYFAIRWRIGCWPESQGRWRRYGQDEALAAAARVGGPLPRQEPFAQRPVRRYGPSSPPWAFAMLAVSHTLKLRATLRWLLGTVILCAVLPAFADGLICVSPDVLNFGN